MTLAIVLLISAFVTALMYKRTEHPKLYAFVGALAGAASLAAAEMLMNGSIGGINIYNAALSVFLGVPGTLLHCLLKIF